VVYTRTSPIASRSTVEREAIYCGHDNGPERVRAVAK
jgi:hypothetical protein